MNTPFQRWCNYKEGYSLKLNELIFTYYGLERGDDALILDPFSGSGSTLLAAKNFGLRSVGFEVNQFSYFFSVVKTRQYSDDDLSEIKEKVKFYKEIDFWLKPIDRIKLPNLSIAHKLFGEETLKDLYRLKNDISLIRNKKVNDLLFFIWLSNLEFLSNYRKAGNGLKIRKTVNRRDEPNVKQEFIQKLDMVIEDISSNSLNGPKPSIFNKSCTNLKSKVGKNSVRGVIFSPPYANCFDYTEIYKVELWFGEFVHSSDDLRKLRAETLRSHLNRKYDTSINIDEYLEPIIKRLASKKLWSKRIPDMISGYFEDMRNVLNQLYQVIEKGGFCTIIVSNSAYGGTVVPTDLILAKISESIGFKVSKIDVARYIITSSQQYNKTLGLRKYLRESVIYMEKQ